MVTLTWIVNDVAGPTTRAEHGYAVWIETSHGRVLLDTGSSGDLLLENMRRLGIDPAAADAIVLSHAHDDHTGGLADLLPALRPGIPLYAHPDLFCPRYSQRAGRIDSRGMRLGPQALGTRLALSLEAGPQKVLPGLWTTGEIAHRPEPDGRSAHHVIRRDGKHVPDPYRDDTSVVIRVRGGVLLLCGCCHAGLLNTIHHVQRTWQQPLVGIAGGVHMTHAPAGALSRTVAHLAAIDSLRHLWLGHCSGETFMQQLDQTLPSGRFRRGRSGDRLTLESPSHDGQRA